MSEIDNLLNSFEEIFEEYSNNCIRVIERIANRGIYKKIDDLTLELNSKFGEYDLLLVSDFIKYLGEFMCKYKNIPLDNSKFLFEASELISETASLIHDKMNEIEPNYDQSLIKRYPKSNLLTLTKKIDRNLFKFESKELVIRKVYFSFEQIYKSLAKVNQDLNEISIQKQTNEINFRSVNTSWTENVKQDLSFTQNFVENLELIIFFMVFYFENQEIILYPLSGHLDEISRMLEEYLSYHLAFRINYGSNFLNQIKLIINQIIKLFEDNLNEIKSVTFVLNELKRRYLDLVFLDELETIRKQNRSKPKFMVEMEPEIDKIFDLIMEELKSF